MQLPSDRFSVRWSGYLKPPVAGEYTLQGFADDRLRVSIDDRPVLELTEGGLSRGSAKIALDAHPHKLLVEFVQQGESAQAVLRWKTPTGSLVEHSAGHSLSRPDRCG